MIIKPAKRIDGGVTVPGDKSVSHRAALIAALANGTTTISNFSTSKDCAATLRCLHQLGVAIHQQGSVVTVMGRRPVEFIASSDVLDCGNSGSTLRMLAGVLAACDFDSVLTGDASLRARPMMRVIEPLRKMGAVISSEDGRPPLKIHGAAQLDSIRYRVPVPSAQVKSCILLAGLNAKGRTEITEASKTRDHTERMLTWFGVPLICRERTIAIEGPAAYQSRDVSVPGDISSAAFLIAAATLIPESDLLIENVGVNRSRNQMLNVLNSLGASIELENERVISNEPVADVRVRAATLNRTSATKLNGPLIPMLIDELPLLAVVGSQLSGGMEIRDAGELRAKETDRINATVVNLRAMGAEVEEFHDGLFVKGGTLLKGAALRSFGDHRIAMAFTVAALVADGESELDDSECVAVSFPEFFSTIETVIE